jgi:hypothetical protein
VWFELFVQEFGRYQVHRSLLEAKNLSRSRWKFALCCVQQDLRDKRKNLQIEKLLKRFVFAFSVTWSLV